jgi:hypothetical protein
MEKKFSFAEGSFFPQDKAQVIGEALEAIHGTLEEVTTEEVVQAARSKRSPLHPFIFDNTDREAALEYRLQKARLLIGSIRYSIVVEGQQEPVETRAFFSMHREDKEDGTARRYVSTEKVMASPSLRLQLIEQAHRELRSWCARYRHLDELQPAVQAIEDALREPVAA